MRQHFSYTWTTNNATTFGAAFEGSGRRKGLLAESVFETNRNSWRRLETGLEKLIPPTPICASALTQESLGSIQSQVLRQLASAGPNSRTLLCNLFDIYGWSDAIQTSLSPIGIRCVGPLGTC